MKFRRVKLSCGKSALVDECDFARVSTLRWYFQKNHRVKAGGYAARRAWHGGPIIYLHRFIMRAKPGQLVDHESRNTLDCRRKNLRVATYQQSNANRRKHRRGTSKFKGVGRIGGKFRATITVNDKTLVLGTFVLEIDAAKAYDKAARKHFGRFACYNFRR